MFGRTVAAIGGLLLALAPWAWPRIETPPLPPLPALSPSLSGASCLAVEITSERTAFELPAPQDVPFDLIVSSLGDPQGTYRVRLSVETARNEPAAALRPVVPLQRLANRTAADVGGVTVPQTAGGDPATPGEGWSKVAAEVAENATGLSASAPHRTFWIHVTDTPLEDSRGYARVASTLVAEGNAVRVYCDDQVKPGELRPGLAEEVVELLDRRIIPRSRQFLGTHTDIDHDGKLTVLLTPWLGRLQGGRTSVNGFVRSTDFHAEGMPPFSNRADMLYLNSAVSAGAELAALLAHEYTHVVCCSMRLAAGGHRGRRSDEQDWLNEAIAHVAERLHDAGWSNLDHRVQEFLERPHETPLVVPDYYRAGLWRDPACRGGTFLFLQWCADLHGTQLLRALTASPCSGVENLEVVTGHSFADLHRHWTIALNQGALPSLELRGSLGRCRLRGPHRHEWNTTEASLEVALRGTATAFVRRTPSERNAAALRVVIEAPVEAGLQVTIVPQEGSDPDRD